MSTWVPTHRDLYRYGGLPAVAWSPDARKVTRAYVAQSTFEIQGHGFLGGEQVRPEAQPGISFPSPLALLTWYEVAVANDDPDFFSLLTLTGSPVVLSDAGSGSFSFKENAVPRIDVEMAAVASSLIANAKAYQGPWSDPVPKWAPRIAAELCAPILCDLFRVSTTRFDVKAVRERGIATAAWVNAHLNEGEPMDDGTPSFDATTDADNSAFAGQDRPPTHWRTGAL